MRLSQYLHFWIRDIEEVDNGAHCFVVAFHLYFNKYKETQAANNHKQSRTSNLFTLLIKRLQENFGDQKS